MNHDNDDSNHNMNDNSKKNNYDNDQQLSWIATRVMAIRIMVRTIITLWNVHH
jgi:hypothetical protein